MVSEDYRRINSWRKTCILTDTNYQRKFCNSPRARVSLPLGARVDCVALLILPAPTKINGGVAMTLVGKVDAACWPHPAENMISQLKMEVRVPHTLYAFVGGHILQEVITIVLTPYCLALHRCWGHPRPQRSSCRATSCPVEASHTTVMGDDTVIFVCATRCMF